MSDYKVNIVVAVKDQATKALGGIQGALGGFGKAAVLGGIGAAVAGVAVLGKALADSTKEAMEAQEVQAQLAAVLKSTGTAAGVTSEEANKLADSLSLVTRYDDETILSAESLLLTFTRIGEEVFPSAVQAAMDMSTAMGTDLQTSILQVGKALNDPLAGFTALRRVGVQFTDDQEAMIKKMIEAGDVMGAQKLILQELATEFGGSAKAAGQTFGGQMDILKNQLGNVKEQIGAALLPLLTQLATTMGPQLVAAAQSFADFTVTKLIPAIEDLVTWWRTELYPALVVVGDWLAINLMPVLRDLWTWIATNLPPALRTMATIWREDIYPPIKVFGDFIAQHVLPLLKELAELVLPALNIVLGGMKVLWELIAPPLQTVAGLIGGALKDALGDSNGPLATFKSILDGIGDVMDGMANVIDGVTGALQRLADRIRNLPSLKLPSIGGIGGNALGTNYWRGGLSWVGEQGPELVNLPRGSAVYPAAQSRAMAAGPTSWTVNVNISGGGDAQATGRAVEMGVLRAARALGAA